MLVSEADYCFSSMIFTSAVAALTALSLLSGLSISLLCARVRRERKDGKESAADVVHTLRYWHSYLLFPSGFKIPSISDQLDLPGLSTYIPHKQEYPDVMELIYLHLNH